MKTIEERLANMEHERWAGWQKYLHSLCKKNEDGSLTIPTDRVERWERQIATPYEKLSEEEKESDRMEARKTLKILQSGIAQAKLEVVEEIEKWLNKNADTNDCNGSRQLSTYYLEKLEHKLIELKSGLVEKK